MSALGNAWPPFLLYALAAGVLASFAFGLLGPMVVTRKMSSMAGAIGHTLLGGIGLGLFWQSRWPGHWFTPEVGAYLTALISALLIALLKRQNQEREDTLINGIWAFGMAVGLIFIHLTPGQIDPMNYLFGNILLIEPSSLTTLLLLDGGILLFVVLTYHQFMATSFDPDFATIRGVSSSLHFFALLLVTGVALVALLRVVGIVLVIALLVLPAALAGRFVQRIWQMQLLSILLTLFFIGAGLLTSFQWDLPTAPAIIVVAALVYFLLTFLRKLFFHFRPH